MTSWGLGAWGTGPWGGGPPPAGGTPPLIIFRAPAPNAVEVTEDTVVSVTFFDLDLDLDTATVVVYANGVSVFTGGGGFASGYAGRTSYSAGRYTVQFVNLAGWGYDATVIVRATARDAGSRVVDDTWQWTTRLNPVCYAGLNPLAIELAIQSPMTTFLELESVRQTFLTYALQEQSTRVAQRENKAARVLYQQAFSTELSSLQNVANIRNKLALKTVVCERSRMAALDTKLLTHRVQLQQGIQTLFSQGALPREYISGFQDYLDSTIYTYRVSLVANLIILARNVESS